MSTDKTEEKEEIEYKALVAYDLNGMAGFIWRLTNKDISVVVKSFHDSLNVVKLNQLLTEFKVKDIHLYHATGNTTFFSFLPTEVSTHLIPKDIDLEGNNDVFALYGQNGKIEFVEPCRWRFNIKDKCCRMQACGAFVYAIRPTYWLRCV